MHYFFPFRQCLECVQGPSYTATASYAQLRDEANCVKLSTSHMGPDVVLLKNCSRICGSGGSLGTAPIVQNKAFFQVDITQTGAWGVGLARRSVDLEKVPVLNEAWVLTNDGEVWDNGHILGKVDSVPQEGDTIYVTFDHIDLKFYRNNQQLPITVTSSIKGQVFPLVYVSEGAILDVKFRNTSVSAPKGFEEIMIEQTLL